NSTREMITKNVNKLRIRSYSDPPIYSINAAIRYPHMPNARKLVTVIANINCAIAIHEHTSVNIYPLNSLVDACRRCQVIQVKCDRRCKLPWRRPINLLWIKEREVLYLDFASN